MNQNGEPDATALLAKAVLAIPALVTRCDKAVTSTPARGTLLSWLLRSPVHNHAADHAIQSLATSADGLTGLLHLLAETGGNPSELALRIHLAADVTLARQVLETAMVAGWILQDHDSEGLRLRGFAAAWRSATEQAKFADRATKAPDLFPDGPVATRWHAQAVAHVQALTLEGNNPPAGGLPALRKDKNGKPIPEQAVPSMTDLAERLRLPDGSSPDCRAIYSLMSGMAHGFTWAFMAGTRREARAKHVDVDLNGKISPAGILLTQNRPSVDTITNVVSLAIIQVGVALDRLDSLAAALAPERPATDAPPE